jgi:hypothetical protein
MERSPETFPPFEHLLPGFPTAGLTGARFSRHAPLKHAPMGGSFSVPSRFLQPAGLFVHRQGFSLQHDVGCRLPATRVESGMVISCTRRKVESGKECKSDPGDTFSLRQMTQDRCLVRSSNDLRPFDRHDAANWKGGRYTQPDPASLKLI